MKKLSIAFIGGGNMARSLIGGLIADGFPADCVHVADPDGERLARLAQDFGVCTSGANTEAAAQADAVLLAVKPQSMKAACDELAGCADGKRLFISVAAGIRETSLRAWLGEGTPIVRAMPNTPALVQSGATALYANAAVSDAQREIAESVLRAVGLTLWVEDEAQMDAVTALSGSGPAYFFLVMEALEAAGRELGLPAETARLLTLQTAFGASKMALESEEDVAALRRRVTSPGGTTERALQVLEDAGLRTGFAQALRAACERSAELAEALGR